MCRAREGWTESAPRITLRQLLAPGVFFVFGQTDQPFSVGIGGQFYPELREISPNAADQSAGPGPLDTFHVGVFLSADLTLFRF